MPNNCLTIPIVFALCVFFCYRLTDVTIRQETLACGYFSAGMLPLIIRFGTTDVESAERVGFFA